MIVTCRNKERNSYDVYYDKEPHMIFEYLDYNLNIQINYYKDRSTYTKKNESIYIYLVRSILWNVKK